MPSTERKPIDTLRCTEAMLRAVIDELDRQESLDVRPPSGKAWTRRHKRIRYPSVAPMLLDVQRSGEGIVSYLVAPRDLSSSGMSLLTGMFIHPGTPCVVTLRSLNSEQLRIKAVIKRCRFVTLRLHELGIRFDSEVDLARFVVKPGDGDVQWVRSDESVKSKMAVRTGELMEALRNDAAKPKVEAIIRQLYIQCRDWDA